MPTIFRSDTLSGADVEFNPLQGEARRGFIIDGITVIPGNESYALVSVLNTVGMPQLRDPHPSLPQLLLWNIKVTPISGTMAEAICIYQTPQYNGPSAYILEDNSVLQSYTSAFVPGTWQPIKVRYDSDNDPGYIPALTAAGYKPQNVRPATDGSGNANQYWPHIHPPEDKVDMTFFRPVRTLTITQVILGRPKDQQALTDFFNPSIASGTINVGESTDMLSSIGKVNDSSWQGKNPGYWLISGYRSTVSRFDGYYTTVASCMTKNNEDWGQLGVFFNVQTGKYLTVSDSVAKIARTLPYQYGSRNSGQLEGTGICVVGPYPTIDFRSVFGFN